MKLRQWRLLLSVAVFLFCIIGISYLATPLPPPKASIRFQEFTVRGTNTYAVIHLRNEGRKIIWPAGRGSLKVEIKTNAGWITNSEPPFTTIFLGLSPSSSEIFCVKLPTDSIEWRATASYYHYNRHNLRAESVDRLAKSGFWNRAPEFLREAVGRCLRLLPQVREEYGEISTPFLTNRPPAGLDSATNAPK
jgi:hypothetical protein